MRDSPWELLTYLPPYGTDFEFSQTHFLYTHADDILKLEDLPPPHTAPTRKHEIFDPEAYNHVDERTDAVSTTPAVCIVGIVNVKITLQVDQHSHPMFNERHS